MTNNQQNSTYNKKTSIHIFFFNLDVFNESKYFDIYKFIKIYNYEEFIILLIIKSFYNLKDLAIILDYYLEKIFTKVIKNPLKVEYFEK